MKRIVASKLTYIVIQLLGLVIAGIGALTICGYIAGSPTLYTWKGNQGMALNTAIAFLFDGMAWYIVGNYIKISVTKF